MEPRHAHAQRWRIQPGHTGKKTSGSSAAPAEDQRESVSQPGVPRRESLFTTERQRFAAGAGPAPEVAHTFDTSSILPSGDRNTQALIDSVPWSSVPTSVDAATVDSLPEGVIVTDDDSSRKPEEAEASSPRAAQMDLTNPLRLLTGGHGYLIDEIGDLTHGIVHAGDILPYALSLGRTGFNKAHG